VERFSAQHLCDDVAMSRDAGARLSEQVGREIVRFQEAANGVDRTAAAILGLERMDLPCLTLLTFGGPASVRSLSAMLRLPLHATRDIVARLEMAGYAERAAGGTDPAFALTAHAREWIERIWAPLRTRGKAMLARFSVRELALIDTLLQAATVVQEEHTAELQRWLDEPAATRKSHRRGGLSPAALRRVHLFVDANLDRPLHIGDLAARAGLSVHHFSRAFRTSTGSTPRAFVERRRLDRARDLIEQTDRALADIAAATGFTTQSRLTTAFKRAIGFTPAAFRRGRRGAADRAGAVS
jgi:AraC family transcriptional regulator